MKLEDNIPASFPAGIMPYPSNDLVIYGSKATLRCNRSLGYFGGGKLEIFSDKETYVKDFPQSDVYMSEIDDFAQKVCSNLNPNASGFDGLQVVRVTEGIYRSLKNKMIVNIKKVYQLDNIIGGHIIRNYSNILRAATIAIDDLV